MENFSNNEKEVTAKISFQMLWQMRVFDEYCHASYNLVGPTGNEENEKLHDVHQGNNALKCIYKDGACCRC